MGTDYRPQERRALSSFRKVSKPLMEKKRRARINLSLEQLKALLEKNYSHQIRKRKLEKADILELSVKYMKSLQHPIQGSPPEPPPSSAAFRAGFRGCAPGLGQFLLRPLSSEAPPRAPGFQLLPRPAGARIPPGGGRGGGFSTTDSGDPQPAAAAAPRAHEAKRRPGGNREEDAAPEPRGGWSPPACSGQGLPGRKAGLWRPW